MRKFIFIFITILILGCNSKNEFINTDLKNISISEYIHNKDGIYNSCISMTKVCTLINHDSINVILCALNSKKPEFRIFMPEYNIELNYADTTIDIGVSQKFIKINGKSFKINKNLSEYFTSIKTQN